MSVQQPNIDLLLRAARHEIELAEKEKHQQTSRLESIQRRPMISNIDSVREELEKIEARIEILETEAIEYQRCLARREQLRGEIASHRDYQAKLDSIERAIHTIDNRAKRLEDLLVIVATKG
jgi:predicted RNase H-like nuclease (RuvC/YqgF family)